MVARAQSELITRITDALHSLHIGIGNLGDRDSEGYGYRCNGRQRRGDVELERRSRRASTAKDRAARPLGSD